MLINITFSNYSYLNIQRISSNVQRITSEDKMRASNTVIR